MWCLPFGSHCVAGVCMRLVCIHISRKRSVPGNPPKCTYLYQVPPTHLLSSWGLSRQMSLWLNGWSRSCMSSKWMATRSEHTRHVISYRHMYSLFPLLWHHVMFTFLFYKEQKEKKNYVISDLHDLQILWWWLWWYDIYMMDDHYDY